MIALSSRSTLRRILSVPHQKRESPLRKASEIVDNRYAMMQGRLPFRPHGRQGISLNPLVLRRMGMPQRPLLLGINRDAARRWETTAEKPETAIHDDEKSGHISANPNESILFFNSEPFPNLTPWSIMKLLTNCRSVPAQTHAIDAMEALVDQA